MISQTENNLLLRLHKWAKRQDENFHTEALTHLLRHLVQYEPEAAVNILKAITGGMLDLTPEWITSVNIETQAITSTGKPDIEIRTLDTLIYVEVKIESGLGYLQLENYRGALKGGGSKNTCLTLLTRYPFNPIETQEQPDVAIRWYQIAEWIECELEQKTIQQPSSVYIVEQFLGFLKQRGLIVEKVSKEFIPGIQSLLNLLVMLERSLQLVKATSISFDIQWEWVGYFFKFDSGKYWIGFRYDRPHALLVEEKTDKNSYEQINYDKYYWGDDEYWYLRHQFDFSSEEMRFFELSKSAQLRCIEQFIIESLSSVKQIQSIG